MNKSSSFVVANHFLVSSFSEEVFWCLPILLMVQLTKTWGMGETILITLVSEEAVAAGAWVSRSPTSCTQNRFLKSWPLGSDYEEKWKT